MGEQYLASAKSAIEILRMKNLSEFLELYIIF